ncbi:MAG: tetratricopeptide repeat protein [Spirochaetes bacterium]|nr:tetratricopeptide repeat protein [Spirochaetota bacterium]
MKKLLIVVVTILIILISLYIYRAEWSSSEFSDEEAINFSSDLIRENKIDQAIDVLAAQIKENLDNYLLFYNAGVAHMRKSDYRKALELFTESIRIKPSISALNNRAYCYTVLNESKKAIDDYTAILKIDENHAAAYFRRGQLYFNQGDFKSAQGDLEKSSSLGLKQADKLLKKIK